MNFNEIYLNINYLGNWVKARAELYKELSSWENKDFEEVFFDISKPDDGTIYVSVFSNGAELHKFSLNEDYDPFSKIRTWMEDISNDFKLSSDLYLEDDNRVIILHYEQISLAEVGEGRLFVHEEYDDDLWESFNAVTHPATGLFYVYDSATESIPVICYCKTKQFLFALYAGLLNYASRSESTKLIEKEWYYCSNSEDNWTFYNTIKSPLIEWCIFSDQGYRHVCPQFKSPATIKETVHMWAEWGDGLFWHQRGGCCGNADKFFVDTDDTEIDLTSMPEVRKWYEQFDQLSPGVPWDEKGHKKWLDEGWELALKIRMMLPETVDLFYHWKYFDKIPGELIDGREIPIIVPDLRTIKSDHSRFKLLLF